MAAARNLSKDAKTIFCANTCIAEAEDVRETVEYIADQLENYTCPDDIEDYKAESLLKLQAICCFYAMSSDALHGFAPFDVFLVSDALRNLSEKDYKDVGTLAKTLNKAFKTKIKPLSKPSFR